MNISKISLILVLMIAAIVLPSSVSLAETSLNSACVDEAASTAICQSLKSDGGSPVDPITGKDGIIYKTAIFISYLAGAVAVIMIIYSGFMFVTSRADSQKITSARQTIMFSLIGLAVIAIAAQIVAIVINNFA